MRTVSIHCETITPMFLAGSNQGTAELRVPAFRGLLRYWLRALLGGAGHTHQGKLAAQEAAVFGSTEAGASVTLRIHPDGALNTGQAQQLLNNANASSKYLWYTTTLGDNNRGYIKPGMRFWVVFSSIRDTNALERAVGAFWLLAHCGGVGTRSRRAAGSFNARIIKQDDGLNLPSFQPTGDFGDYFKTQLALIQSQMPKAAPPALATPDFDSLMPGHASVWLAGMSKSRWEDAVAAIGEAFKDFRFKRPPDTEAVYSFLSEGKVPPTVERASFGLPLSFRFPNGNATVNPANHNRRASPLWIQIVKLADGQYDALLTFFDSQFLPVGEQLEIGSTGISTPGSSLVPTFISKQLPNAQLLFS